MDRSDNRQPKETRSIELLQGILDNADGSSKITGNEHSIICGIYGPVEVKNKDEILDEAYIEVNYKPSIGIPNPSCKYIEKGIKSTFESIIIATLHPRTMIQINLQPQTVDGDVIAYCINATTLALIDAGVPMSSLIASSSAAVFPDGTILLDPTSEELKNAESCHTFAFSSISEDSLVYSDSIGKYSFEEYEDCYQLCYESSQKIIDIIKDTLEKKMVG
ncbi:ribosomal protein S5 domain 2-like protein [Neoconidiobolus thromboides FSU 785]|nr:ribosomal protein S5 domain 2-like protein [Neoconidiobolus thromboides FSU 785]